MRTDCKSCRCKHPLDEPCPQTSRAPHALLGPSLCPICPAKVIKILVRIHVVLRSLVLWTLRRVVHLPGGFHHIFEQPSLALLILLDNLQCSLQLPLRLSVRRLLLKHLLEIALSHLRLLQAHVCLPAAKQRLDVARLFFEDVIAEFLTLPPLLQLEPALGLIPFALTAQRG